MPGQLGPMRRRLGWPSQERLDLDHVEHRDALGDATISSMPASAASMMASAANGGGTKITIALAPVSSTASATVSKTGTCQPSTFCRPCPA